MSLSEAERKAFEDAKAAFARDYPPVSFAEFFRAGIACERRRAARACRKLAALIPNNGEAHALQIEALTDAAQVIERGQP